MQNFITNGEITVYRRDAESYKHAVARFGLGDVIKKARQARGWTQEELGKKAEEFILSGRRPVRINKNTVSKIETNPYSSEFGTVWRLVAALDLTFGEIEREIEPPWVKEAERRVSRTAGSSR